MSVVHLRVSRHVGSRFSREAGLGVVASGSRSCGLEEGYLLVAFPASP